MTNIKLNKSIIGNPKPKKAKIQKLSGEIYFDEIENNKLIIKA